MLTITSKADCTKSSLSRKSKVTVNFKTGLKQAAQYICTALLTLLMMTAESTLSKRPVLRFTVALIFLLKPIAFLRSNTKIFVNCSVIKLQIP